MIYITINFPLMRSLGLTLEQYAVWELVNTLSSEKSPSPGWCTMPKAAIRETLGYKRAKFYRIWAELKAANLIELNGQKSRAVFGEKMVETAAEIDPEKVSNPDKKVSNPDKKSIKSGQKKYQNRIPTIYSEIKESIYHTPIEVLRGLKGSDLEVLQMQNRAKITDWDRVFETFNDKVEIEQLDWNPNVLIARLRSLVRNWKNDKSNVQPGAEGKRTGDARPWFN